MTQADTSFADATQRVVQTMRNTLAGLNALAEGFRPPTEDEVVVLKEMVHQLRAKQLANEAEGLRRNPGRLRYRSRRPLWLRLKYPLRGHRRPASLIHERPDWYDY